MTTGVYCLTDWVPAGGDASGAFAAIFDDIDAQQLNGAAIMVPPGDLVLSRRVEIRHDFLTIAGYGNGFRTGTGNGGGSRLRVQGAVGFYVAPRPERLRSLTIRGLLLDGGAVRAGRTGIFIERANDNLVFEDNAIKEFANGVVVRGADALHVRNNMILENISCLRIEGGIASVVSHNRMGGKPGGVTLFAENNDRLVVSGNNVFPDGYANVVLKNCRACTMTGNQLQSFYTGMLHLEGGCADNVISGNQLVTEPGPDGTWNANAEVPRAIDFGVIRVEGQNNLLSANSVRSRAPEPHPMVVVAGVRNTVDGLLLRADAMGSPHVEVTEGMGASANTVLDTVDAPTLFTSPGVEVRFRPLPSV